MKMKHSEQALLTGFLALLALFPFVTQSNMEIFGAVLRGTPKQRALQYREVWREQQKEYLKAREKCREEARKDPTVVCDDFNGVSTLKPAASDVVTDPDPELLWSEKERIDSIGDLDSAGREILRRAKREGTCPTSLRFALPGFYELCLLQIGERARLRGIETNFQTYKQGRADTPTLNERREQLEGVRPDR